MGNAVNNVAGLPLTGGTLTGALTISSGGLTVSAGGAAITGASSVSGGVLTTAGITNATTNITNSAVTSLSNRLTYTASAGSNSSASAGANILTPANTNGTSAQLSDTSRDYMIYLTVGTAGTTFVLAIGPTAGVANTIVSSSTATTGEVYSFRLPAGWFWEWSATTATLATQIAIAC